MTTEAPAPANRPHNPRVLVSAASLHGATAEIAQAIGQVLSQQGLAATVMAPGEVDAIDDYEAVVIGSAVYAGHWLDPAKDFVNRFRTALADRPVWLFSSGPVGDPSGKLAQAMGKDPADLPALLEATHAREHRIFAGKLDPRQLSLPQRASLLVFRGLNGDFRDWAEIRQWAEGIARQLALAPRLSRSPMARQDTHRPGLHLVRLDLEGISSQPTPILRVRRHQDSYGNALRSTVRLRRRRHSGHGVWWAFCAGSLILAHRDGIVT